MLKVLTEMLWMLQEEGEFVFMLSQFPVIYGL